MSDHDVWLTRLCGPGEQEPKAGSSLIESRMARPRCEVRRDNHMKGWL